MQSLLIDRDGMITELAELYGVHARMFRPLDQAVLNHAWLIARGHWGLTL